MALIGFVLGQYAQLLVFITACWGLGTLLWPASDLPTRQPLRIALGMGLVICALQGLAIAGLLNTASVLLVIGCGLVAAALQICQMAWPRLAPGWPLLLLLLATLPTLFAPLRPPLAWDALMYHLPHAREWALTGHLGVHEWLRYPWFPYNFDLLFAAALVLGNDVLPQLIHASTGWVTGWLLYRLAMQYLPAPAGAAAALATVTWLVTSRSHYSAAYVDMAVAMFLTAAFTAMQVSIRPAGRRAVWLAAFLLGVAAGSKYQVLGLLPLFGAALLWRHRMQGPGWRIRSEWDTWLVTALCFALPCLYWYARNALLTGDPFNPLGGRLLGFTDWNLGDYLWQLQDLRNHAAWPHWALWPALAAPLLPSLRRVPALRAAWLVAAYMALVWLLSSRYPRYLLPAYPLLSLLSAAVCIQLLRQLPAKLYRALATMLVGLLVLALGFMGARSIAKSWPLIASTPGARDTVLQQQVAGYQIWRYLKEHPEAKLYQMNLEDSLYYAPRPTWGDVFGPWRYRDYQHLGAQLLHHKLKSEGFTALVIHTGRAPTVAQQSAFLQYFELMLVDDEVSLYRLRP
ncbi:hypothetical protein [Comamonas koreensis]|uniref:hypothetical protein n=1 Tax=Comamonas koreensis TaxID=160825 RepID=UPI0015FA1DE2|nr:hypothetical protein [Comamonas koreensis]